jgi:hypothetical protein
MILKESHSLIIYFGHVSKSAGEETAFGFMREMNSVATGLARTASFADFEDIPAQATDNIKKRITNVLAIIFSKCVFMRKLLPDVAWRVCVWRVQKKGNPLCSASEISISRFQKWQYGVKFSPIC